MKEELEDQQPTAIVGRDELIQQIILKLIRHEDKLSYSSLSCFWDSPKDFIDYKLAVRVPTPAMTFGVMLHCLILQPDLFETKYFSVDDSAKVAEIGGGNPRNTTSYKQWKAEQMALAGERILVTAKDQLAATIMANNVKYNRASRKILGMMDEFEKGIEWTYENFLFRGFIDGDGEKATLDVKMVPDASFRKAQQTIIREGYWLQAPMYLTGLEKPEKPYYIICVDKTGGVSVHLITKHLMEEGFKQYAHLVKHFNLCILEERFNESYDFWSERHDGIFACDKPSFMY